MSGRDRFIKNDVDKEVRRILNLETKLKGKGITKIIIPSKIIDTYSRLEEILGLKLKNHSDISTEASNSIYESYKRGEIQNEKQYRNVLENFST